MSSQAGSSKISSITQESFEAYNESTKSAILNSTKLAVALPMDIGFHRSVDKDFSKAIDACSERTLLLTNKLLNLAEPNNKATKGKEKLENQEEVLDRFGTLVVDILDQFFERADMSLDELYGRTRPAAVTVKPIPSSQTALSSHRGRLDPSILHASHIRKPQLKFKKKVDNSNNAHWTPGLKHKYNAQIPLGHYYKEEPVNEGEEIDFSRNTHPYAYEIEHISYPSSLFEHKEAKSPNSFENTPFTMVDSVPELEVLLEKLRNAKEIAVDLEHHSFRTFSGFVCLMQISTREEDFIIDTLSLREELESLNEIFTDPKIVKVFHGAESDIIWLQQDFNIFVVNLFDTYHASRLLDFPKHGLGALLEMYCDFVPDKRYQLADWRIRPLPAEMLKYARSDTHFLLYIYDNLRNALLDRADGRLDLMQATLNRSKATSLRIYEPEVYDFETGNGPGGWNTLADKWGRILSGKHLAVFRSVHAWRDAVARSEDESTRFVLPNHYLFQIAEKPPADMTALLANFKPVPALVRTKGASLLAAIRSAVQESSDRRNEDIVEIETNALGHSSPEAIMKDVSRQVPEITPTTGSNLLSIAELDVPSLWGLRKNTISTTSSSLLGAPTKKSNSVSTAYASEKSSLFPKGWSVNNSPPRRSGHLNNKNRYLEVLSRIHNAITVGSAAPIIVHLSDTSIKAEHDENTPVDVTSVVSEQIEIPFVPPSQRSNNDTLKSEVTDTIVIVGKPRQKKRKRSRILNEEPITNASGSKKVKSEDSSPSEDKIEDLKEDEEFDYSTAPNFLDGPGIDKTSQLNTSKGKKGKGQSLGHGNFPAPPRAYNEVRGANKSHTFKR